MIYLQTNESLSLPIDAALLEHAAQETLNHQSTSAGAELTLVLTDDTQMLQLNLEFLGVHAPTDVLSFPSGDIDPDTQALYLGDILISIPRAQIQAQASGHPVESELQLLVVHGVLHLLGYDHAEERGKAEMWRVQTEILTRLGCGSVAPGV